jgi:hypothetical protein
MSSILPAKTGILLEQTGHKRRSPRKLNHHYKSRLTAKRESPVLDLYCQPLAQTTNQQAKGIPDAFPLLKPRTTCTEEQDVKSFGVSRIVSGRLGGEETCLYEKLMLQREEKE